MKLIELFIQTKQEDEKASLERKSYHTRQLQRDLKRWPSPQGEGNRLSPLTISPGDVRFDRALAPNGCRRKDGSIIQSQNTSGQNLLRDS